MIAWVQRGIRSLLGIKEAVTASDIFGTPETDRFSDFLAARSLSSIWALDPYRDKSTTLRTVQDLRRARTVSRALAEANPNAAGLVERLPDYAVACGSTHDVHSTDEGSEPPKRLSQNVKRIVKDFKEANCWADVEAEMVQRLVFDGEFFLQVFPQDDAIPTVRFREPQQVQPPKGEDWNGPWSFGIKSSDGDTATPVAYCFHDFLTDEDDVVEARWVIHGKVGVVKNAKRGIPLLWAASEELRGSERLRFTSREGLKAREAVAYFRVFESASQSAVQSLQDATATGTYERSNSDGSTTTVAYQRVEPGSVVDIPKSLTPQQPPASPNGTATESAVKLALEAVAARFGVPAWMVTGASDATNFAASLTAESPMIKSLDRFQAKLARWVDAALTLVVEIAVEAELLPADTLEQIDLVVTFPSPVVRNAKEETDRRQTLNAAGVMSKATWAAEEGLDPEHEQAQLAQEVAPAAQPGSAPPSTTPGARYAQLTGSREN